MISPANFFRYDRDVGAYALLTSFVLVERDVEAEATIQLEDEGYPKAAGEH